MSQCATWGTKKTEITQKIQCEFPDEDDEDSKILDIFAQQGPRPEGSIGSVT